MVCSGAYPDAPRCPMFNTGASGGAAPIACAVDCSAPADPAATTSAAMSAAAVVRTSVAIVGLALLKPLPPCSLCAFGSGDRNPEPVVGRGFERAHAELLRGFGELAGYLRRQVCWWCRHGHRPL